MATETETTSAREPGPGQVPVLVTRLGGQQRIFPVGTPVRVGRDPAFELVSVNPLVSRQCHGVITSDPDGATYVDQSRRGTFLDGRQLSGPLRITESVVLRLGDPATGEELGITPPLTSTQIARNHGRRLLGGRMRRGALVGVVVAAVAGLATFGFVALRPAAPANGPSASVLRHAEAATVKLVVGPVGSPGWGSGTVISPNGLILTNVHVAEPQAPGFAVASADPGSQLDHDPPYLTVETTQGPSAPVVARYRARPVAADGYLDLALVQIYATASGQPVSPGSLHLPYLKVGNVSALQLDQHLTVLGFPGVADSNSITVTSGVLSTFVPDPQKHVTDPRFELETTARVAHGNSGGAAITDAGQLIGVPSLSIPGEGSDLSWRLRSVAEARPLIAAARAHSGYKSKILVQSASTEAVTRIGVAATAEAACAGSPAASASTSAVFGFGYTGFPVGLDVAFAVVMPDGTPVILDSTDGLPMTVTKTSGGCLSYALTAAALGAAATPAGTYHVQLFAGPNLDPVGPTAKLTVTAPTTNGSQTGAGN